MTGRCARRRHSSETRDERSCEHHHSRSTRRGNHQRHLRNRIRRHAREDEKNAPRRTRRTPRREELIASSCFVSFVSFVDNLFVSSQTTTASDKHSMPLDSLVANPGRLLIL